MYYWNAQGDLIFDYRGTRFPYGFVIDQGRPQNPVEINAGAGTKGVNVDQGFIKYRNPLSGGVLWWVVLVSWILRIGTWGG